MALFRTEIFILKVVILLQISYYDVPNLLILLLWDITGVITIHRGIKDLSIDKSAIEKFHICRPNFVEVNFCMQIRAYLKHGLILCI